MFNPLTADNFCCIFVRREEKIVFPYPLRTLSLTVSIQNACLFLSNSFHSIFILKWLKKKKLVPSGKFYSIFFYPREVMGHRLKKM